MPSGWAPEPRASDPAPGWAGGYTDAAGNRPSSAKRRAERRRRSRQRRRGRKIPPAPKKPRLSGKPGVRDRNAPGQGALVLEADGRLAVAQFGSRRLYDEVLRCDACAYCGGRPSGTLDHVQATADGGERGATNVVGACWTCNHRKGDRRLLEFLLDRERGPVRRGR